jgi:hypothetical protein
VESFLNNKDSHAAVATVSRFGWEKLLVDCCRVAWRLHGLESGGWGPESEGLSTGKKRILRFYEMKKDEKYLERDGIKENCEAMEKMRVGVTRGE